MAAYSATFSRVTLAAVADTVAFTAGQAAGFLRSGGANQLNKVNEVYAGGASAASNPTELILARSSTLSVGALTVGNLSLKDVNASAPTTAPSFGSTAATTFPQRSSTAYMLELEFNAFGCITRWQARIGEEITCMGTTQPNAELVLSAKNGTGLISGHILFEGQ